MSRVLSQFPAEQFGISIVETSNVPAPRAGTFTPAQRPGRYHGCSVLRYLRPRNLAASFAAATETAGVTAALRITTTDNQRAARSANQHLRWWLTQPESWYSFYRPMGGRKLSRPRHCSKGAQPVPRVHSRAQGSIWYHKTPVALRMNKCMIFTLVQNDKISDDKLKHHEAYYLINLLAYFGCTSR